MFGSWIKTRLEAARRKDARLQIEDYLSRLDELTDAQRGALAAVTALIRANMEADGIITPGLFTKENIRALSKPILLHKKLSTASFNFVTSGRVLEATATSVWVHSLWCFLYPELEPLGLKIWAHIERGLPYMDEAWVEIEKRSKRKVPEEVRASAYHFPPGLDPRKEPQ
jgi:hypothetical protein